MMFTGLLRSFTWTVGCCDEEKMFKAVVESDEFL
jgi:hypothetical protein